MRRTLLGQCRDCKNQALLYYCSKVTCKTCKLHTKPTPMGRNEKDEVDQAYPTNCLCLCDATDEELRAKTCKYKVVAK